MRTIILGGGIAGLTVGYQLKKQGKDVLVLEKEKEVGGLARTINFKGNRFDLGGHRFWTKKDEINQFLIDLLGDELLNVSRSSKIYFNNRFFDYPLKFSAILSLGLFRTAVTGVDFLYGRMMFQIKKDFKVRSFEDYIIRNFGFQLYKYFFKDYTEKIWGIPCTQLSGEWAAQRIKGLSIRSIIKNMIKPAKNVATLTKTFYYPKLGISRIPEKLSESLGIIHEEVKDVKYQGDKILSVNGKSADVFVSSIPITQLALMLNPPEKVKKAIPLMKYRAITFVFLTFKGKTLTPESWIYFPDPNIPFGRIHEPKNWSKHMCKKGESSVVIEFFCDRNDDIWSSSDKALIDKSIYHLQETGIWEHRTLSEAYVLRVDRCYPMYKLGYDAHLKTVNEFMNRFENLHLIGRNGTFKYLNIDHVLEMGLRCAENIIEGKKRDLSYIGSEQEYQEEKRLKK